MVSPQMCPAPAGRTFQHRHPVRAVLAVAEVHCARGQATVAVCIQEKRGKKMRFTRTLMQHSLHFLLQESLLMQLRVRLSDSRGLQALLASLSLSLLYLSPPCFTFIAHVLNVNKCVYHEVKVSTSQAAKPEAQNHRP